MTEVGGDLEQRVFRSSRLGGFRSDLNMLSWSLKPLFLKNCVRLMLVVLGLSSTIVGGYWWSETLSVLKGSTFDCRRELLYK
jgi:hypothetical protein